MYSYFHFKSSVCEVYFRLFATWNKHVADLAKRKRRGNEDKVGFKFPLQKLPALDEKPGTWNNNI